LGVSEASTARRQRSCATLLLLCLPTPALAADEVLGLALREPYLLLDEPQSRRERLEQLTGEASLAGAISGDCAASLGARRLADLQSALSAARLAVGDADGALQAARAATRCAPRDANVQAQLANAALAALDLAAAAEAIRTGRRLAPDQRSLQLLQLRLEFAAGRWSEVIALERRLDLPPGSSARGEARLLAASAGRRLDAAIGGGAAAPDRAASHWEDTDASAAADRWPVPLLDHLRGRRAEAELRDVIAAEPDRMRRAQMLCETLFHLGQRRLAHGETAAARRHFAAALRSKALELPEYSLAQLELARLRAASPAADR
jgi:hypothetical protein